MIFSINLGLFLLGLVIVFKRTGSILNIYGIMYIIGSMISFTLLSLTTFSATLAILLTEGYQGIPVFAFFSSALIAFFAIVFWKWWSIDSAVNKVKVIVEGF